MKPAYQTALLLCCLLHSLQSFAQVKHAPNKQSSIMQQPKKTGNSETLRRFYEECLNGRRLDHLPRFISEAYTGPRGEIGPAGVAETLQPLLQGFPDIQWKIEALLEDGDKVVVRWAWQGTNTGAFGGRPPSGKKITNHAIAVYQFKAGKAVHAWLESDRLGFLMQMGIVPQDVLNPPAAQGQGK